MPTRVQSRDTAFQAIEQKLRSAKSALACATIALGQTDEADSSEDIARVERVLQDTVEVLHSLQDELDRFSLHHIAPLRLQAVQA